MWTKLEEEVEEEEKRKWKKNGEREFSIEHVSNFSMFWSESMKYSKADAIFTYALGMLVFHHNMATKTTEEFDINGFFEQEPWELPPKYRNSHVVGPHF